MKALVGAFNQEKALVGAFSVIVQTVVEPMDRFTALLLILSTSWLDRTQVAAPLPRPGRCPLLRLAAVQCSDPARRLQLFSPHCVCWRDQLGLHQQEEVSGVIMHCYLILEAEVGLRLHW